MDILQPEAPRSGFLSTSLTTRRPRLDQPLLLQRWAGSCDVSICLSKEGGSSFRSCRCAAHPKAISPSQTRSRSCRYASRGERLAGLFLTRVQICWTPTASSALIVPNSRGHRIAGRRLPRLASVVPGDEPSATCGPSVRTILQDLEVLVAVVELRRDAVSGDRRWTRLGRRHWTHVARHLKKARTSIRYWTLVYHYVLIYVM